MGSWRTGLCVLANLWQRLELLSCSQCWGLLVLECLAGHRLAGSQQEPPASLPDLQSANIMPDLGDSFTYGHRMRQDRSA